MIWNRSKTPGLALGNSSELYSLEDEDQADRGSNPNTLKQPLHKEGSECLLSVNRNSQMHRYTMHIFPPSASEGELRAHGEMLVNVNTLHCSLVTL